ncbi:MAG: type II secretion system protein [Microcoleus sp. PH2017_29_MFU_D_A]|uniref:hormogonium polysaccharide secretion pseudopilin HpsB n=1 Tax=unclassified Microcoleus TaxID=2642155 RepID=UPI001E147FEB|nr:MULTISPECIES: hormogonium polysaccharide secretion pseudopilin HpsB [unclassified Microcoleus]MCC3602433.1 type II secretion system protein [Microcoleus sp. PH2017_29_MFU_D_A]MCC3633586.1 type II secretion system protein [Microcoleus sp. PH2017_37_MFU_D_B]
MKRQQQQNLSQSRDGGYTIIESLVAMIVVSVLMIAIAPVMAFSVATRVQARRVELATQAARAYIDALRTGAIRPTGSTPASLPGFPKPDTAVPPAVPAAPTNRNDLYCGKPDCSGTGSSQEFLVQGLRSPGTNPTDTGYSLTVRVYRADGALPFVTGQQSVANSGLGNPKAPLVEMKTEIPASTVPGSYGSLCSRIIDPKTGAISTTACK